MRCNRCPADMLESGRTFHAIGPKGDPNRVWVCENCLTEEELRSIDPTVLDITNTIQEDNHGKRKSN